MLNKLQTFFKNTILTENPTQHLDTSYFWLCESNRNKTWIGIPKEEITEEQLDLLSVLFDFELQSDHVPKGNENSWYSFLFQSATLPEVDLTKPIRFIQIHFTSTEQTINEMESAVREFFHNCVSFLWLNRSSALIVEEKNNIQYDEKDFHSITVTLENDFYLKPIFYVGKFRLPSSQIREDFLIEQKLFQEAKFLLTKERLFTFERVLPLLAAKNLPDTALTILTHDIVNVILEDPELLRTLEVFLESNSNVSVAAKKLYIHRNTLQYRLERFTERTGIHLKGIENATSLYLACKLASMSHI